MVEGSLSETFAGYEGYWWIVRAGKVGFGGTFIGTLRNGIARAMALWRGVSARCTLRNLSLQFILRQAWNWGVG